MVRDQSDNTLSHHIGIYLTISKNEQRLWEKNLWEKCGQPPQTCSRPPLKSMDIFGTDCSGPGLPLCLHHLASRLAVAQHGPIRIRLLSLRLVLSRKSFTLSRNDDPRITPGGGEKGEGYML